MKENAHTIDDIEFWSRQIEWARCLWCECVFLVVATCCCQYLFIVWLSLSHARTIIGAFACGRLVPLLASTVNVLCFSVGQSYVLPLIVFFQLCLVRLFLTLRESRNTRNGVRSIVLSFEMFAWNIWATHKWSIHCCKIARKKIQIDFFFFR